ncbi:MAG: AmmeMemoRadiSam system protein B, partial [Candidatus Omnitrophica bacterium]|nr:AmmeMemoRadiSam system protein B [Candidatus Omnitrophota bacterium]
MNKIKVRQPAVAGQFYPSSPKALRENIQYLIDNSVSKIEAIACMLPHAGYMYSGRVAAQTLSHLKVKDKIILLGPNHTGYGVPFSIMAEGSWQMPFGEIKIDSFLAKHILKNSSFLEEDISAHIYEHSLEVELPILQYFKSDFSIVPIVLLSDELSALKKIGEEIAKVIKELDLKNSTLIVASSDMTHYEPQAQAQKKDREAINAILELNEDKLMQKIHDLNISMCGYAPTITMLSLAKSLGAKGAKLVKYQTSGE